MDILNVILWGIAALFALILILFALPRLWGAFAVVDNHIENKRDISASRTLAFDQINLKQLEIEKEIAIVRLQEETKRLQIESDGRRLKAGTRESLYVDGRIISANRDYEPIPGALATNYAPRITITRTENPTMVNPAQLAPAGQSSPPGPLDLANLLHLIDPSSGQIFLGIDQATGLPVYEHMSKMFHSLLNGATGYGKGEYLRMFEAQNILIGGDTILIDRDACLVDADNGQDYRPLYNRLAVPPIKEDAAIMAFVDHLVNKELPQRKLMKEQGKRCDRRLTVIIDEYPTLAKDFPDLPEKVALLLRGSRKYNIFLALASQGGLTKTLGLDSSERNQFGSSVYLGGDVIGGAAILAMSRKEISDIEGTLGQGNVLLSTISTPSPIAVKAPFVSNRALYALLGTPDTTVEEYLEIAEKEHPQLSQPIAVSLSEMMSGKKAPAQEELSEIDQLVLSAVNERLASGQPIGNNRLSEALNIPQSQVSKAKVKLRASGLME